MHWQTEHDKQTLADWRARNRRIVELEKELWDFQQIFWNPSSPEQKAWASQVIKSIEHELRELNA